MTKYREILRLASLGLSQQSIADSSGVSKKTVNRVLKQAKELIFVSSDFANRVYLRQKILLRLQTTYPPGYINFLIPTLRKQKHTYISAHKSLNS